MTSITPPPPRVYSYLRFSSAEQRLGDSTRRQIAAAQEWAAKRGLKLDEDLRDEGVSGFRGANLRMENALGAFVAAVDGGAVPRGSILIVESLDRLSRDRVLRATHLLTSLLLSGIRVVTLVDGKEFDEKSVAGNPLDLMISLMVFMRSNEESETKAHRLRAAWTNKRKLAVETGRPMTATCPHWLRKVGDKFELVDERVEVLRRIFTETLAGDGQHMIAQRLTQEQVETWKGGKVWHRTYIKKLLENPAVIGIGAMHVTERLDGGGRVRKQVASVENYYPPALDLETWDRAKLLLGDKKARRGKHAGSSVKHLLANLARCPICEGAMTRINKGVGNGKVFLVCSKAKAKGRCFYKQVLVSAVDAAIYGGFSKFHDTPPSTEAEQRAMDTLVGLDVEADEIIAELENYARARRGRTFTTAMARREETLYRELEVIQGRAVEQRERLLSISSSIVGGRANRLMDLLQSGPQDDLTPTNTALREAFTGVTVDYESGLLVFHWRHGGTSQITFDGTAVFA